MMPPIDAYDLLQEAIRGALAGGYIRLLRKESEAIGAVTLLPVDASQKDAERYLRRLLKVASSRMPEAKVRLVAAALLDVCRSAGSDPHYGSKAALAHVLDCVRRPIPPVDAHEEIT